MTMNPELATSDLNLAATLVALGHELVAMDKSNPKRVRFLFRKTETIETAIRGYWDNTLILPAQTLLGAQKTLKARLYSDA